MDIDDLETAASAHLPVAPHLRGHVVAGPFYDNPQDASNYSAIQKHLKDLFGDRACSTCEHNESYYILVNPENGHIQKKLLELLNEIEEEGLLDDSAYWDLMGRKIDELWAETPFSCRLIMLADEAEDLAGALGENAPAGVCHQLEQQICEMY